MSGVVSRFLTAAEPSGGRKRKGETPTGEFGTSSTVSRSSQQAQEMVKLCCTLHPALDLLHHRPVRASMQMLQSWMAVHGVLMLGQVLKQGAAYAIPYNYARPTGDFPTGRGPARQQPTHDYPSCPIADIFLLTGNIGGRGRGQEREGRGERLQGPEGGRKKRRGGGARARDAARGATTLRTRRRKRKGGETPR